MAVSRAIRIIKKTHGVLNLDGLPLVRFRAIRLTCWRLDVKRVIDVAGAVTGTIALLPVFLIVAVLTGLISLDPVLFKQTRIGKDGRGFTFYKFRSMVSGDDSKYSEYVNALVEDGREAGVDGNEGKVYEIIDDARITFFGSFLRRTSLGEFPRIINVVKDNVSLIDLRSFLRYECKLYKDWEKESWRAIFGVSGFKADGFLCRCDAKALW